jgi:deoxycytidylate deaminase
VLVAAPLKGIPQPIRSALSLARKRAAVFAGYRPQLPRPFGSRNSVAVEVAPLPNRTVGAAIFNHVHGVVALGFTEDNESGGKLYVTAGRFVDGDCNRIEHRKSIVFG